MRWLADARCRGYGDSRGRSGLGSHKRPDSTHRRPVVEEEARLLGASTWDRTKGELSLSGYRIVRITGVLEDVEPEESHDLTLSVVETILTLKGLRDTQQVLDVVWAQD